MRWSRCVNQNLHLLRQHKHLLSCLINISVFSATDLQNRKDNPSSEYPILAVAEVRRQIWIQTCQAKEAFQLVSVPQKKELFSSSQYKGGGGDDDQPKNNNKTPKQTHKQTKNPNHPQFHYPEFFWAKTIKSIQYEFTSNTQIFHQMFSLNLFCTCLVK